MNIISVIAGFSPVSTLVLLFVYFIVAELVRKELAVMYIHTITNVNDYYGKGINRAWLIINYIILIFVTTVAGCKFTQELNNAKQLKENPPRVEVVKKPEHTLNKEIFFYCLDTAKNKNGVTAEQITACKEVAIIELTKDGNLVKYT